MALDRAARKGYETLITQILGTVRPLTMVPESGIRFTIEQAIRVTTRDLHGVMVECGVWRGGCSIAMLLAQRELLGEVRHPVYMLDSFQGLPVAQEADGPLARQWQQATDSLSFMDNCRAAREDLQQALEGLGFRAGDFQIVDGWFNETVPQLRKELEGSEISLLRLDADWHESTRIALNELMPLVVEDAVVILDDYYAWDGCARAVHEYLVANDMPYRVRSLPQFFGAYFVKKPHRDRVEAVDDGVGFGDMASEGSFRGEDSELQTTTTWLEEQRSSWERTALESLATCEQLRAYVAQLENGKNWLDEQRASWERTAIESQELVGRLSARLHELEQVHSVESEN